MRRSNPIGKTIMQAAFDKGAIIRWAGGKIILSPPLIFTRAHVDEAVAVLDHALTRAQENRK